jgi:nicotinic acetylcholine receptor
MVQWTPSTTYKSACHIDMAQFPFDEQTCQLNFSSWHYNLSEMDLIFLEDENYDLANYMPSSEWELVSTTAERILKKYRSFTISQLTYYITIRRLSGFYIYVLIAPSLLLSFLTPGLFWIPPSPDRTAFGQYLARLL